MHDSRSPGWHSVPATRHNPPAGNWLPAEPASYGILPATQAGVRIPPFMTHRGNVANDPWPLQDFLELGALASAVPCARLHARQVLWEWGLASLGESSELVVSELMTNAVKASRAVTPGSPVRLWLMSDLAQILILVWDASPQPPVRVNASGEAENGRGLILVEAISEQWGWYGCDDRNGKFVWAIAR
jgi:anti-sigma regulatory factor (Ser/Thr protein kinase)